MPSYVEVSSSPERLSSWGRDRDATGLVASPRDGADQSTTAVAQNANFWTWIGELEEPLHACGLAIKRAKYDDDMVIALVRLDDAGGWREGS